MKSIKVISIAALTMAAISGVANAAISDTQKWQVVGEQVQNTSNGHTLCISDVALQQATVEECGSNPTMQNIRRVNFDLQGSLRLDAIPSEGYSPLGDKVVVREYARLRDDWEYRNGQLKIADVNDEVKCLDIEGGKNVKGAKLYLATCTK
ncbi:hypothetical protein AC791_13595 [Klebsiella sp. RIT-PI-d]|uniref:hypothetical protein n=1 Tax=Klebsiella sp. RIT-PI-d TaxID=1681196 RepID=UPI000675D329|nr:hypothetical protein [Klebsiella sp. RIT-PI-d]KNC09665.1 hypothetical protein AC791_13595 [Klebsiella sp. RIT-PI-d]